MDGRRDWGTVFGVAASAAVPAAVLHALAGEARRGQGLSAAPFGPPGLLVAQVASALPLGWGAAAAIGRLVPWPGRPAWAALGLLLAGTVAASGPAAGAGLDEACAGFLVRAGVRSALAVLLVIPWLAPLARRDSVATWPAVGVGLLATVLVPLSFAYRTAESRTAEAASQLETGRMAKAVDALETLCELGSWHPIGGVPPAEVRRSARDALGRLAREVVRELPAGSSSSLRLERAFQLIQLDRTREAEILLRPLAGGDLDAALLLAALDRDAGRWAECERGYRAVLGAVTAGPERLVTAFDGLAGALHASGRAAEVPAVYAEAARRLPRRAGYFAMQLGRHELDAGRPAASLAALSEAWRLDPSLAPSLRPLLRQVRVRTPACVLSRAAPATVPGRIAPLSH